MSQPELSVVIPIRNRAGVRLDNCLRSLRWQRWEGEEPEILLSDYGSDPEQLADIREIAARHRTRVAHTAAPGLWNRSHALNLGIQAAAGRVVLCTDCDMIFAPTFLRAVRQALEDAQHQTLVLCKCRDLPNEVPEQPWKLEDFETLLEKSTFRVAQGTGACQATLRQWFYDVRGYDEKYVFWGFEDKDMVRRARRSGLSLSWVHEQTQMLHQWHPTTKNQRYVRKQWNKLRYKLTGWIIRKNPGGWGALKD